MREGEKSRLNKLIYLVRRLICIVESPTVGTSEKQHSSAGFLIIHRTDVQWRVAAGILAVHIGAVHQQMLQMMHQAIATSLHGKE